MYMKMKEKMSKKMLVGACFSICCYPSLKWQEEWDKLYLEACIRDRQKPYWFLVCIVCVTHKVLSF